MLESKKASKANLLTLSISDFVHNAKGERADSVLARSEQLPSRSQLKSWFLEGRVLRQGEALRPRDLLYPEDLVEIDVPQPKKWKLEPRAVDLDIYYEDEALLVVYKPRGLSVHPASTFKDETTLVHALLDHCSKLSSGSGVERPGIVHRLDKDTEGLLLVAKNDESHRSLAEQLAERRLRRCYWALCHGHAPATQKIEAPISRHPIHRKRMAVNPKGKPSTTEVRRLNFYLEGYSWIECQLQTGRTHQIRVHLASLGHPLLKDFVYGKKKKYVLSQKKQQAFEQLEGQALIAYKLSFEHPRTKEVLTFEAKAPRWLKILTEIDS